MEKNCCGVAALPAVFHPKNDMYVRNPVTKLELIIVLTLLGMLALALVHNGTR